MGNLGVPRPGPARLGRHCRVEVDAARKGHTRWGLGRLVCACVCARARVRACVRACMRAFAEAPPPPVKTGAAAVAAAAKKGGHGVWGVL